MSLRTFVLGTGICLLLASEAAQSAELCRGYGPQAPRDIAVKAGANQRDFMPSPAASEMNLCDIHFHVNAEHKGPGFKIFAGETEHGGFKCNGTAQLTQSERAPREGGCEGLRPGDTIEVHWVHTTCEAEPGPGLESCFTKACTNPQLRVEAQVFLVVNDPSSGDFGDYVYRGNIIDGLHQAKALPTGTGEPIQFAGSTTGPTYTQSVCSPVQVSWSVRPQCAKIGIASLDSWCANNVFKENHAHGVRQLVTAPELLAKIR
jgi:hypothetical protein